MPETSPVPAPGRYDARKATRKQYGRLLAERGWKALAKDEREWLDRLYWGDAPDWPAPIFLVHHAPLGSAEEGDVDVPSIGEGRTSVRIAPLFRVHTDPEAGTARRFQGFQRFWTWWLEARPGLVEDGKITLAYEHLSGAPLIKVAPPSVRALKLRFIAALLEEGDDVTPGSE